MPTIFLKPSSNRTEYGDGRRKNELPSSPEALYEDGRAIGFKGQAATLGWMPETQIGGVEHQAIGLGATIQAVAKASARIQVELTTVALSTECCTGQPVRGSMV